MHLQLLEGLEQLLLRLGFGRLLAAVECQRQTRVLQDDSISPATTQSVFTPKQSARKRRAPSAMGTCRRF